VIAAFIACPTACEGGAPPGAATMPTMPHMGYTACSTSAGGPPR
jgi:hypothetical protein